MKLGSKNVKTFVLGLDGVEYYQIKKWIDKEKLPNIKRVADRGIFKKLSSIYPPFTIPAWNCMTTGRNLGKLGTIHFLTQRPNDYHFYPYFTVEYPEAGAHIWDILDSLGLKVSVINLPNIHSAYKVNGVMISGWLYYNDYPYTYPDSLKTRVIKLTGAYGFNMVDSRITNRHVLTRETWATKNEALGKLYKTTENLYKVTKYLLKNKLWNFFMVTFSGTDWIQHHFYNDKKVMLDYFTYIDRITGDMMELAGDNTLKVIVSDHGFGRQRGVFHLNNWLEKEGFLKSYYELSCVSRMKNELSSFLLGNMARRIGRKLPITLVRPVIKFMSNQSSIEDSSIIDWSETEAYGVYGGGIKLNLKGRECEGIVLKEKSQDKIKEIKKRLNKTAELNNISIEIIERDKIFDGEYVDSLPELLVSVEKYHYYINTSLRNKDPLLDIARSCHNLDGIFIASGDGIKNENCADLNINIIDITPTILYAMGVPIPKDLDGRVVTDIFTQDFVNENPVTFKDFVRKEKIRKHTPSENSDEMIKRRLRDLGYI